MDNAQIKGTDFLAILFIGGGCSWAREPTSLEAIVGAKQQTESDWGSIFVFSDEPAYISVYDASNVPDGWYADIHGVFAKDGTPLEHLFTAKTVLKNKKKRR